MGYSSDVTDKEWEILIAVIAEEEENKTPDVDKTANSERDILST
jgi:hypothetical protein